MQATITLPDLYEAYKKFKSEVYHNPTNLFQRRLIAEFEAINLPGHAFDFSISNLYDFLIDDKELYVHSKLTDLLVALTGEEGQRNQYFKSLLERVEAIFFPKSNRESTTENYITVRRVKPFISMPVELHIIDTLWAMHVGSKLESSLNDDILGNRILLTKHQTIKRDGPLFIPYFGQYTKWRNGAIDAAIEVHKSGNSATLINIDIKECYNSIRISSETIKSLCGDSQYSFLNDSYASILAAYSKKLKRYKIINSNEDKFPLPIGLLSSGIVCNWYLSKIDSDLKAASSPIYYSRYVDDISIVYADNNYKEEESTLSILRLSKDAIVKSGESIIFRIDKHLEVNATKTHVFHFHAKKSNGVLQKYKSEISKISSESRLSASEDVLNDALLESIYTFTPSSDLNKLAGLKDISATIVGVSAYLSRAIEANKFGIAIDLDQIRELVLLLDGKNALAFEPLWEKIFTILVLARNQKAFIDAYEHVYSQIDAIQCSSELKHLQNKIKYCLTNNLLCCLEMATSLDLEFMNAIRKEFEISTSKLRIRSLFIANEVLDFSESDFNRFIPIYTRSNMIRHHYLKYPLASYESNDSLFGRSLINYNFTENALANLDVESFLLSPRRVKFHELMIYLFQRQISTTAGISNSELLNDLHISEIAISLYYVSNYKVNADLFYSTPRSIDNIRELIPPDFFKEDYIKAILTQFESALSTQSVNVKEIRVGNSGKFKNPRIGLANIKIPEERIESRIQNITSTTSTNIRTIMTVLEQGNKSKCEIVILPECSVNCGDLTLIASYSATKGIATVFGTEHENINNTVYNFICSFLPIKINGVDDLLPVIRIKNHYSHRERDLIEGHGYRIPTSAKPLYHHFIWNQLYFSVYYCFELADIEHRSLFKSKVDFLIACEWNKDINYFSNLVESTCRDVHAYFAQVNTSQYGDSRITSPTKSERMDLIRIKGGEEAVLLSCILDIDELRKFQITNYNLQKEHSNGFKPVPPTYAVENVRKRLNGDTFNRTPES